MMTENADCDICKKRDDCPFVTSSKGFCSQCESKKLTNADRIRSMSDEELAEFMKPYDSGCPRWEENPIPCSQRSSCRDCWIDWLKQEETE